MAIGFRNRLKSIQRTWASPILEPIGFLINDNCYEKHGRSLSYLVDFQRSQFSSKGKAQFTMNCGVYFPGLVELYANGVTGRSSEIADCCINARIGMLAPNRVDQWWEMTSEDNIVAIDATIGEDVAYRIRNHVLPFLDRFHDPLQIVEFLVSPRSKADKYVWPQPPGIAFSYAAIIASLIGKRDEAASYMQRALEESRGKPGEECAWELSSRLQALA